MSRGSGVTLLAWLLVATVPITPEPLPTPLTTTTANGVAPIAAASPLAAVEGVFVGVHFAAGGKIETDYDLGPDEGYLPTRRYRFNQSTVQVSLAGSVHRFEWIAELGAARGGMVGLTAGMNLRGRFALSFDVPVDRTRVGVEIRTGESGYVGRSLSRESPGWMRGVCTQEMPSRKTSRRTDQAAPTSSGKLLNRGIETSGNATTPLRSRRMGPRRPASGGGRSIKAGRSRAQTRARVRSVPSARSRVS